MSDAETPSAPEIMGPYRLLNALGRGGMGVVFKARHERTGQIVALKTVRTASQWAISSLRREIHTMARIQHPQIVRIVDEGLADGIPWYAMELLNGTTLRRVASGLFPEVRRGQPADSSEAVAVRPGDDSAIRWWTDSLPRNVTLPSDSHDPGQDGARPEGSGSDDAAASPPAVRPVAGGRLGFVLTVVSRLCAPLSFLHGEGIVHRDLKLENVLLSEDENPILMDLGLASLSGSSSGRERLELIGGASGSIATMAPEQLLGETVDARADLYALGCLLYELLTGTPPFSGALPAAVVYGHLREAPRPPSKLVSGVPPALDELVLRLLAKEPRERLGHASDVAAVLSSLGARDPAHSPVPRPYLYRPGFAGRKQTLAALESAFSRCRGGESELVLIGGESGVGKTRLMIELGRHASASGAVVLSGECVDSSEHALECLRRPLETIADRCREAGLAATERVFGARGRLLSRYEPAIANLPGQQPHGTPTDLSPEMAQVRLYSYLLHVLQSFNQGKPVVLLQDDLQWAGELSIGFFEYFLRLDGSGREGGSPLLVVATYRSDEVHRGLQHLIEVVASRRPGSDLHLDRLGEASVASMVADMLAVAAAPEAFTRFLTRHSEGIPFFVVEYLRGAVEQGLVRREQWGAWHVTEEATEATETTFGSIPTSEALQALLSKRLDGLSADARRLVQAAAVVGRESPFTLICEVARLEADSLFGATAETLRRQVLEEPRAGILRFVHDKLREAAYAGLLPDSRLELHRSAARALETGPFAGGGEQLAARAHHWESAGELDRARDLHLAAARRARERHEYVEAERLYQAHLRLARLPTAETVAARCELAAEILPVTGKMSEAMREQTTALEEARLLGQPAAEARCLRGLGDLYRKSGRMTEALGVLEQALLSHRSAAERHEEGTTLASLSRVLQEQGRIDEARQLIVQALEIHRETRDRRLEGKALGDLSNLDMAQGRFHDAIELGMRGLDIVRETQDRQTEATLLANLAICHQQQGTKELARNLYDEALRVFEEIGDLRAAGVVMGNRAGLPHTEGRYEEAASLYERALTFHRKAGARRSEAIALGNFGSLRLAAGNVDEARDLFTRALSMSQEVGDRRLVAVSSNSLASLLRLCHAELEQASSLTAVAEAIGRDAGDWVRVAYCLCERGYLELAQGRSAGELLKELERVVHKLRVQPESDLNLAVGRLRRAAEAHERGLPLFRGELPSDISLGLRQWLVETGQTDVEWSAGNRASDPVDCQDRPAGTA